MTRRSILAACALFALWPVTAATAQDVRVDGRVQWIAGTKLSLIPRAGGTPISVDLSRVPLEQYAGVREGNPVRISGVASVDNRRMIATDVQPWRAGKSASTVSPSSCRGRSVPDPADPQKNLRGTARRAVESTRARSTLPASIRLSGGPRVVRRLLHKACDDRGRTDTVRARCSLIERDAH